MQMPLCRFERSRNRQDRVGNGHIRGGRKVTSLRDVVVDAAGRT
jgi:hypothetical protein